jgi:type IV pilus assembly protein PilA
MGEMLQALRERRHDDRGFTLIELMIVVLIIGILIAVGLPTFLGARERAQDRAAQALLRTGMAAAKTYYTDSNSYSGLAVATIEPIEQSIEWVATAPADAGPVLLTVTGTTTVLLTTKSGSGAWFCLKDVSGDSTAANNGIFYGRSTSSSCTATDTTAVVGWAPPAA